MLLLLRCPSRSKVLSACEAKNRRGEGGSRDS